MDLTECRAQIDGVDDKLIELFIKRMRVSEDVARYKRARGLPIRDPARERDKLNDICARVPPEYSQYAQQLYALLFELSCSRQREIIDGERD